MGNLHMRAQAAIEYLMNYGWAVLVIVAVLAILVSIFGMLGTPESCVGKPATFLCEGKPAVYYDNQSQTLRVVVEVANQGTEAILIKELGCVVKPNSQSAPRYERFDSPVLVPPGNSKRIESLCYSEEGEGVFAQPGQSISLTLILKYNFQGDVIKDRERIATVTISTRVLE